jgi:predicted nucleic acid-binding protein
LPEVICDTSPLQYLHQIRLLHILPGLVQSVLVPPAVVQELSQGRKQGVDLPDIGSLDWISVRSPEAASARPLVHDLGPGETEVLLLALEMPGAVAILDDGLARATAKAAGVPAKGTLGLLLDAKRAGLVREVKPLLDGLEQLRFRLAPLTRKAVLELADERP